MNYRILLNKLFDIKDIHWAFALTKEQIKEFNFKNSNEITNNIAFSPINKVQKIELLTILKTKKISINALNIVFEKKYINFLDSYSNHDKLLEKYMEYFYEWLEIITEEKIDIKIINRIKKNIDTKNSLFWFFFIKKIYTLKKYNESYSLIEYVKKQKIIDKQNSKYNELILYEFYSIRMSKNYLYEKKWKKKLCNLSKKLKDFEVLKVTTVLECNLLNDEKGLFDTNFKKYEFEIFNWNIIDILNIYELSVYMGSYNIINKINNLLQLKDIKEYIGSSEYLIYEFLTKISNSEVIDKDYYRKEFEDKFDIYHYDWFLSQEK
jgi:hypothetical protein